MVVKTDQGNIGEDPMKILLRSSLGEQTEKNLTCCGKIMVKHCVGMKCVLQSWAPVAHTCNLGYLGD
jgi:hypothetical protein